MGKFGKVPQPPKSRVPAMLAARRKMIDMHHPVLPVLESHAGLVPRGQDAAKVTNELRRWNTAPDGELFLASPLSDTADLLDTTASEHRRLYDTGSVGGVFSPMSDPSLPLDGDTNNGVLGLVSYPKGSRSTRRHEVMHGMNHAAIQGMQGLPYWSRIVASNPLGLGRYLDELSATAVQGRGALAKKTVTWPVYAAQYAREGNWPSAAAAMGSYVAPAALPAAGAAATGYLLRDRSRDSSAAEAEEPAIRKPPQRLLDGLRSK